MTKENNKIADLNDRFRRTFLGGKILLSAGIARLPKEELEKVVAKVKNFDAFEPGDDPYGEHDFGAIEHGDHKLFWKIDYYNADMSAGSGDPANPAETTRVLTIMFAQEY